MARRVAEETQDDTVVHSSARGAGPTREEWLAELAKDPEAAPGVEFDAAAVIREMRGPLPD